MKILYIARVTDPNEYDELLRETLSAALGADIALQLHQIIKQQQICIICFKIN